MTKARDMIARHLREAHATELALARTLEAHLSVAPGGSYRTGVQRHLGQTQDHARRIERRLEDLGTGRGRVDVGRTMAQDAIHQGIALSKGPLDLVRGGTSPEKVLKNARDECASEALEIATYEALERLALNVGDLETAELAAEIRAEEETMLEFLRGEIPALADAAARADVPASQRTTPADAGGGGRARGGRRSRAKGRPGSRSGSAKGGSRSPQRSGGPSKRAARPRG
jgi:ferritin-like metal-binding protein YciE